ncbi:uncharacterized protein LOC122016870 [Zingiber officinale]|uniref:Uncharacterized protein n=1 Tax=Zingiber officinale TaxID=94328 RepID=A0A8J5F9E1_ZINOF|nr:uncharacterized protein LOC122016870 [Zingiber officinale]KAG6482248.1 hypothetical protein ZIOFF_058879 [Zingiber officinale]
MGNLLSCGVPGAGKVVLSDGTVRELYGPTPAAELMVEHPHEFVVDLCLLAAANYTKVIPLSADDLLETSKVYVMLPMARTMGSAGLSMVESRRALAMAKQTMGPSTRGFLGVLGGASKAIGVLLTEVKSKAVERIPQQASMAEYGGEGAAKVESWSERPEVLIRQQYWRRRWRPSLDTILEMSLEKHKVPHWLF